MMNIIVAVYLIVLGSMCLLIFAPNTIAVAVKTVRANMTATRTIQGLNCVAKRSDATCVLSPNSARNIIANDDMNADLGLIFVSSSSFEKYVYTPKARNISPDERCTSDIDMYEDNKLPKAIARPSTKRNASIPPAKIL